MLEPAGISRSALIAIFGLIDQQFDLAVFSNRQCGEGIVNDATRPFPAMGRGVPNMQRLSFIRRALMQLARLSIWHLDFHWENLRLVDSKSTVAVGQALGPRPEEPAALDLGERVDSVNR